MKLQNARAAAYFAYFDLISLTFAQSTVLIQTSQTILGYVYSSNSIPEHSNYSKYSTLMMFAVICHGNP